MTQRLYLRGRIVLPDRIVSGTLSIAAGQIASIEENLSPVSSTSVMDFEDCYIMPGSIEVHGHMREPGHTHKEDRLTGTRAAVAGGVTTILDMPNTAPPTTTKQLLQEKIRLAEGRSYCDYGFIFGGTQDNLTELETVDPRLIVGVKFFMAGHETTPTTITDLGSLYAAFETLAKRGLIALVHAENQQLINHLSTKWLADDDADGEDYSRSRGEVVVGTAVVEAISLAKATDVQLYLCHLSTPSELAALAWAKEQGLAVFGEAVTYHLILNTTNYTSLGTLAKVSPALRQPEQQAKLWEAFSSDGLIDAICSEHTPHTLEEKEGSIRHAASGMPGIQESLPLLLTAFIQRFPMDNIEKHLIKLARLRASNIARIFALKGKGEIKVGNDADLVVVDPDEIWEIKQEDLFSKCGWSAYEGWKVQGRPIATLVRGEMMLYNGRIVGDPKGKRISRTLHNE